MFRVLLPECPGAPPQTLTNDSVGVGRSGQEAGDRKGNLGL